MFKWSRQYSLNTGLIVVGLLAILSSGASLFASRILVERMAVLAIGDSGQISDSQALRVSGLRVISDGASALLTGDESHARAARSGGAVLRVQVGRLRARIPAPEGRALVEHIRVAERDYREALELGLRAPDGQPGVTARAVVGARGLALEQALDSLVAHLEPAAAGGLVATRASVRRTHEVFNLITSISICVAVILVVVLVFAINRTYREEAGKRLVAEEGQTRTTAALLDAKAAGHRKDEFLATVSLLAIPHHPAIAAVLPVME